MNLNNCHCIIKIRRGTIFLSYFRPEIYLNKCYIINFKGYSPKQIFDLINLHSIVINSISISHALYLGKELYKAHLCILFGQTYIQE